MIKVSAVVGLALLLIAPLGLAEKPPRMQSQIKGLLVIELANGSHVGGASQMNATAFPGDDKEVFALRFNQDVGKMMTAATNEVEKFMRVRHPDTLPIGHTIEFGFADKHSPKDGPSAAVACALMAESIISGVELSPVFAVTGDITATGEVRPVGGVGAKVKGALRKGCDVFAVPKENKAAIADLYVMDGLSAVSNVQIMLIENFEDALALGRLDRSEKMTAAIADFKMVSDAVKKNPKNASHPKVIEKLKSILEAFPENESARLIALHGLGKGVKNLSLGGSLNEIESAAKGLKLLLNDRSVFSERWNDSLWQNKLDFKELRQKIDTRTKPLLQGYMDISEFFRANRTKQQFTNDLRIKLDSLIESLNAEYTKIANDEAMQEELMVN